MGEDKPVRRRRLLQPAEQPTPSDVETRLQIPPEFLLAYFCRSMEFMGGDALDLAIAGAARDIGLSRDEAIELAKRALQQQKESSLLHRTGFM